jgi:membrane protease YdiL (CAAX protease family)
MENNPTLSDKAQALYDDKRFPKAWQAVFTSALMYIPVYAVVFILALFFGDYNKLFASEFGSNMFNTLISQFFAVLIPAVSCVLIFKKEPKGTFRLKKGIDPVQILLIVLISVGIFYMVQIVNAVFIESASMYLGPPIEHSGVDSATNISQLLFEIVLVAGLPAIFEELFFRGVVLRAYERRSPVTAVIMSSLIFAIMHGNLQQLVYAFLLGIILGTVTILTDSLLASVLMHFTLNGISVIISYTPVQEQVLAFGESHYGIFLLLVLLALPALAGLSIFLFVKYTRNKNKRLYGSFFTSEMKFQKLMPKEQGHEIALNIVGWVFFILINLYMMYISWYGI